MKLMAQLLLLLNLVLAILWVASRGRRGRVAIFGLVEHLGLGVRVWIWNFLAGKQLTIVWRWEVPETYYYPHTRIGKIVLKGGGRIISEQKQYIRWWFYDDPAPTGLPVCNKDNRWFIVDPETLKPFREMSEDETVQLFADIGWKP